MKRADSTTLRPGIGLSFILLLLMAACLWLGFWQLDRMSEKQTLIDTFEQGASMSLNEAISTEVLFARVSITGNYSTKWHLLLDNRILNGQVGVHVLSMFYPVQGDPILINRGWLPLAADRRSLPDVPTTDDRVSLSGILSRPVEAGVRLGEPDALENLKGAKLITYLDMPSIKDVVGDDLSSWIILLGSSEATGFQDRNWQPTVMLPAQHRAYAVQWFALALAMIIMWLVMSRKRVTTGDHPPGSDSTNPGQQKK